MLKSLAISVAELSKIQLHEVENYNQTKKSVSTHFWGLELGKELSKCLRYMKSRGFISSEGQVFGFEILEIEKTRIGIKISQPFCRLWFDGSDSEFEINVESEKEGPAICVTGYNETETFPYPVSDDSQNKIAGMFLDWVKNHEGREAIPS